jgi:hypothetical protein
MRLGNGSELFALDTVLPLEIAKVREVSSALPIFHFPSMIAR